MEREARRRFPRCTAPADLRLLGWLPPDLGPGCGLNEVCSVDVRFWLKMAISSEAAQ